MAKKKAAKKEKIEVKEKEKGEAPIQVWRPFDLWADMDRIFRDFRRGLEDIFWFSPVVPWHEHVGEVKVPHVDLIDAGSEYKVIAEFPGIKRENIEINATPTSIEICGKAETKVEEKGEQFIRKERSYTNLCRYLAFPQEVIPEKTEASLTNGVLEIKIPKKTPPPEVKRHKIEVK
ncbi:MAG: Hsp20/alpha crystallin family protein [Methanocellales archaeon]